MILIPPPLCLCQIPLCSAGWHDVNQEKSQDCGKVQQPVGELENQFEAIFRALKDFWTASEDIFFSEPRVHLHAE